MVVSNSGIDGSQGPAVFTLTVIVGQPRLGARQFAGMLSSVAELVAGLANDGDKVPILGVSNLLSGFSEYSDNQRLAVELSLENYSEPLILEAFSALESLRSFKYTEAAIGKSFLQAAFDLAQFVAMADVQEMWLSLAGGPSVHITLDTFEHAMEMLAKCRRD